MQKAVNCWKIRRHGNQFWKLDLELKPSPLGDRFPPRRGKMSHSDKKGSRWRVAPDEGYLGQNAVVLHPHQSPAVTASPDRGKPSCGKLISADQTALFTAVVGATAT